MALELVTFRRGPSNATPQERMPGTLLIEIDTGAVFIDHNAVDRIQLKDTTKLSLAGGSISGDLTVDGSLNVGGSVYMADVTGNLHIPHGTTAGTASAYTLDIEGVNDLYDGLFILAKFHVNNANNAKISVNDSDYLPILYAGASVSAGMCRNRAVAGLIYNSTDKCWDLLAAYSEGVSDGGGSSEPAEPVEPGNPAGGWYGTCSSTSADSEKYVDIADYESAEGNILAIRFENNVAAGATMDVAGTGAAPILYKNGTITDGVIYAGTTALMMYANGSYHLVAQDEGPFPISVNTVEVICENIELNDSNIKHTFDSAITLDESAMYYMDYASYDSEGTLLSKLGVFSKVVDEQVNWLYATLYPVTLTSTTLIDNGRTRNTTTVLTIKKVGVSIRDPLLCAAMAMEGNGSYSSGLYSHAEGSGTLSSGPSSHAEGIQTISSGSGAHAEGKYSTATQEAAHAEGSTTYATGTASHAEGSTSVAGGTASHAEGYLSQSGGYAAHAEGYSSEATMQGAHAEGRMTYSGGVGSHAEGYQTVISGRYGAHTEGAGTAVVRMNSVLKITAYDTSTKKFTFDSSLGDAAAIFAKLAYGTTFYIRNDSSVYSAYEKFTVGSFNANSATITVQETVPSSNFAPNVAVFLMSLTSGDETPGHAEGRSTLATGANSHAEGNNTIAAGEQAHARGLGTRAYGRNQTVLGRYNIIDTANKYALIVGNGTDDTNRSNALTVDWEGNVYIAGDANITVEGGGGGSASVTTNRPVAYPITLAAADWDSETLTLNVSLEAILDDESAQSVHIEYPSASVSAVMNAGLYILSTSASNVEICCNELPESDINIYIVVQDFVEEASDLVAYYVTLTADGWGDNNQQMCELNAISADESTQSIHFEYPSASVITAMTCGLYIVSTVDGGITFACATVPEEDFGIYVVIQAVTAG